jgi:hypothetical protein
VFNNEWQLIITWYFNTQAWKNIPHSKLKNDAVQAIPPKSDFLAQQKTVRSCLPAN